jgi:type IV secretory pathway TrbD component
MAEQNVPQLRPVYRTLHRPLTVCGVDRRLFFLALLVGAASFNLFYSFAAGVAIFSVIYTVAYWTTSRDPQLLQIVLRSAGHYLRYDAARHDPTGGVR